MSYFSDLDLKMKENNVRIYGVKDECTHCGDKMSIYGYLSPVKFQAMCINQYCSEFNIEKVVSK